MSRPSRKTIAQLTVVLLIAAGLKAYYSAVSVNGLRWVLAPTAFLAEFTTGETFHFESYSGYMNEDLSFLIAASCSGVNFLIAAFLMLALARLWRRRGEGLMWSFIPATLGAAYVATIIANTIRITIAMRVHRMEPEMVWVNPEQLHRFEGIFVYFGCLLLLYVLSEGLDEAANPRPDRRLITLRRVALPLAIYWVTTLGIPLVNGAYRQGAEFWEHFGFVVLTPLVLLLPLAVLNSMRVKFKS
jgi:exosortase K